MKGKTKQKYYVVWNGAKPGVYDRWADCLLQVRGYAGALYKAFDTHEEANAALNSPPHNYLGAAPRRLVKPVGGATYPYLTESIAVDAACSGNPGDMEYRGVYVRTGQELFRVGPMAQGTNNIGEFLALVHGLALLKKHDNPVPVYSDSRNAILWVQQKKCRTKLEHTPVNTPIFELIERAETWLRDNNYATRILKWDTAAWGEIPADFGRK